MGFKVITGTLEAHGAYKTVGDVTTFDFIRIHGDDGRDHLLKLVRAAEYMFSYLLTEDLHGTFVVADKQSPIVVGLSYGGQVYEDVLPWQGKATFWKRVTLFFVFACVYPVLYLIMFGTKSDHGAFTTLAVVCAVIGYPLGGFLGLLTWGKWFSVRVKDRKEFDAIMMKLRMKNAELAKAA